MNAPAATLDVNSLARGLRGAMVARVAFAALVLWAVVVIAIRFAEPILDGDLFWHLKYAEQMIARGTLVPDHTLYSWTPTTNDTIYCTWLADLVLYGLYRLGGLGLLFAFRYLCIATCAALLLAYLRARGGGRRALPALALVLVSLLGSVAGTIIKPELLSLVAFHALVFAYAMARSADRTGRDAAGWFLAMPAIMTIWVNVHGGFIFAAPLFVAAFAGEMLARRFVPRQGLTLRGLSAMLVAFALCGVAILLSPYGWHYPAQLLADYVLHAGPRVGEAWNTAYQPLLSGGLSEIAIYGLLMAVTLAGLVWAARRRLAEADFGLLLALLLYLPLFLAFVRTTSYFAVVAGYVALDLLALTPQRSSDRPATTSVKNVLLRSLANGGAAFLLLAAGATALHAARFAQKGSWIGFGIAKDNPVVEAEFLAASKLGPRLYNIFDAGGYLLWRLDPAYKVMIDPRFFPYKAWFADLYDFSNGRDFEEFLKKYPADTAIVDLDRVALWKNFLQSKDWRLVFYGPTSAVFVDRSIADDRLAQGFAPKRFDHLRNGRTALDVFDFALVAGDYATAWKVLAQAEAFAYQVDHNTLQRAVALRDGYRLLAAEDYDGALARFAAAQSRPVQGWREPVILKLLEERAAAEKQGDIPALTRYEAALQELAISMHS